MSKFKTGDRVEAFGTDDTTTYFATGNENPYRVTGTIVRTPCHGRDDLFKIEIDNSGSQDSEGYNAIALYHGMQLRRLKNVKRQKSPTAKVRRKS